MTGTEKRTEELLASLNDSLPKHRVEVKNLNEFMAICGSGGSGVSQAGWSVLTLMRQPGRKLIFFIWYGRSRSKARSLHEKKLLLRKLLHGHSWSQPGRKLKWKLFFSVQRLHGFRQVVQHVQLHAKRLNLVINAYTWPSADWAASRVNW